MNLKRYKVPSLLLAIFATFALAACGGSDSEDAATTNLAKYMPADAFVYIEGAVRPDQEVSDNVEALSTKLTGSSLSDTLDKALSESGEGDITYKDDVDPWIGDNAALYVSGDLTGGVTSAGYSMDSADGSPAIAGVTEEASDQDVGLVAETTDVDAAQAFIEKSATEQGKATDAEYEGFDYKIAADDGSALGIVDDNVVFATSKEVFEGMVDASTGDNLESSKAFSDVSGKAAEGSLVNIYTANDPVVAAASEGADGFDLNSIYSALGMDITDTGTIVSLVPEDDEISMVGATNLEPALVSGDASGLIETFPADSVFAVGSGDVGANVTKVIDAIDKEGIEGILDPGELRKNIGEASNEGLDVLQIVGDLQEVGFFVNGKTVNTLGGALVATTSDPAPLKNALGAFSSLIGLAADAKVRPLSGNQTGFTVRTPELPGRPVTIALQGDRLVIAIGRPAAQQALTGNGDSLADSAAYQAAADSLDGQNVDMFGSPAGIGKLLSGSGETGVEPVVDVMKKFQYMVSGSGTEDQTFAFNLGLQD